MASGRRNPGSGLLTASMLLALSLSASGAQADDGQADDALFKQQCKACHTYEKDGGRRQGPNLWGIFDREIGGLPDFPYSKGLKAEQRTWTADLLNQWLEEPKSLSEDTYMMYRQADPEIRRRIIVFLETATRE